jgi:hypothetical protein
MWDGSEREPFCFTCGWRRNLRITAEQARNRFKKDKDFWQNLLAVENNER